MTLKSYRSSKRKKKKKSLVNSLVGAGIGLAFLSVGLSALNKVN